MLNVDRAACDFQRWSTTRFSQKNFDTQRERSLQPLVGEYSAGDGKVTPARPSRKPEPTGRSRVSAARPTLSARRDTPQASLLAVCFRSPPGSPARAVLK